MKHIITILTSLVLPACLLCAQPKNSPTGSAVTVSGEKMESYPSLDLSNSFTGVSGLWVTENSGATGVRFETPNTSIQMRAFSNPLFIVDGMHVEDISEIQLSPEEIESVTVLSDILDKIKYGPEASRGAIYITTKRGLSSGLQIRAGYERGIDFVDRMPQWCNGVEYATLNNLARSNYNQRVGSEVYQQLYSEQAISEYAKRDPLSLDYPNVDYASLMLKNTRDYNKAYVNVRGGSETARYNANIDYAGQGDILKVGAVSNYNRFGAKMDVSVYITRDLTFDFSFFGTYSIRKSPLSGYGFKGLADEFPVILSRILLTPPIEYPLRYDTGEGSADPTYIISRNFPDHPYASVTATGSYSEVFRVGLTRGELTYDMSSLLKGLKARMMVGYNVAYLARNGQGSDFIGYYYDKTTGATEATYHVGVSESSESTYLTAYMQGMQCSAGIDYDRHFGDHGINASLSCYLANQAYSSTSIFHKQMNTVLSAGYDYRGKYLFETACSYSGSSALKRENRFRLFPSVGLAWVASKEGFIQDLGFVNHLKFRAQAGIVGNENYANQYLWQGHYDKSGAMTFGPSGNSTATWLGSATYSTTATTASTIENDGLGWEINREVSVGADLTVFNHLTMRYTHFRCDRDGIIQDVSTLLPLFYGSSIMYDNYDRVLYWGDEVMLDYSGTKGDFRYSFGGSFCFNGDKYLKNLSVSNLESYVGHGIGEFYGYDFIGRFSSEQEIASSPTQVLGSEVCVGDLKYRDVTGDGVIDSNDKIFIGNSRPKYLYSLFLSLGWKRFDLSVVGTGKAGYDLLLDSPYFKGGWGDNNYSTWIRDRVQEGTYPGFSYVEAANNFVQSAFWMTDGSFFKIQNVELGCTFDRFRIFLRGANLLTLSRVKEIDPESPYSGIGSHPLFRTVTAGLAVNFK